MKKVLKRVAIIAACIFALTVVGTICLASDLDNHSCEARKVILPTPVRDGHELEGVFLG